jgi:phosphatidylglycerophosphatase A
VVGQLLALSPLLGDPASLRSPLWLVTGFVAFRLFDVWKPGPVRWAERRFPGGAGVMLDDVVAGAFAALLLVGAKLAVSR